MLSNKLVTEPVPSRRSKHRLAVISGCLVLTLAVIGIVSAWSDNMKPAVLTNEYKLERGMSTKEGMNRNDFPQMSVEAESTDARLMKLFRGRRPTKVLEDGTVVSGVLEDFSHLRGTKMDVRGDGTLYGPYGLRSSYTTYYLRVGGGGANQVVNTQTYIGAHEKWYIENFGGKFGILSARFSDTYVRMIPGGTVTTQSYWSTQEDIVLIRYAKNPTAIYSWYAFYGYAAGRFLKITSSGSVGQTAFAFSSASDVFSLINA